MKSVLMIAYGFPPEGNAGAHRPLRFVRQLPSLGWHPTVLTLDTDFFERFDPTLLRLVPNQIEVIRVRNRDPWQAFLTFRTRRLREQLSIASPEKATRIQTLHHLSTRSFLRNLVRKAEAWIYHPDSAMGWIQPAVKAAIKSCAHNRPDIIWATAGPVSSFKVAQKVARYSQVPYVLDFRDSWTITYNAFEESRPAWAKRRDRRSMHVFLREAQAVVFRYEAEAECYWRAYPKALEPSRIHIIPNGFEGGIEESPIPKGIRCKILYTGTLVSYRYDTFLRALRVLKQTSRALSDQLECHFIGEGTEMIAKDATAVGVSHMVTTQGPISTAEITRITKTAHALLILGRGPSVRGYELFAGAKLFGYLKAGRPIIGVLPSDETQKTLIRLGVTTVADVDEISEIVYILRQLVEAWASENLSSLCPNKGACAAYSADRQTEDLVRALEGTRPQKVFTPGSVDIPMSLTKEIDNRMRTATDATVR